MQALGHAAGELAQAEWAALRDELARSGRRLAGALLLLAGALFTLFWALGLVLYLAVEVADHWLPRWGAVASVLGAALLVLLLLAWLGWRRLERLEGPAVIVGRRWRSHRRWWDEQFPSGGPLGRRGSGDGNG